MVVTLDLIPSALIYLPAIAVALIAFLVIRCVESDVAKVALGAMGRWDIARRSPSISLEIRRRRDGETIVTVVLLISNSTLLWQCYLDHAKVKSVTS